jgi:heat shock protein HslJ
MTQLPPAHAGLRRRFLGGLGALLLVSACMSTSATGEPPPVLDRTAWVLATLPDRPLPAGFVATLRFDTDRVAGSDGCNRFTGPWRASGSSLGFGPRMGATLMTCPDATAAAATAFGRALSSTAAYRIDAGTLVLLDGGGRSLATFVAQSEGLAGTQWEVTAYNNGKQAVVSLSRGSRITLAFTADGVTGSSGCNRFSGPYSIDGEGVKIGPLRTTRMMCAEPADVMAQERAFLAALQGAGTVRREGNRLELRTAAGAIAVQASAAGDAGR